MQPTTTEAPETTTRAPRATASLRSADELRRLMQECELSVRSLAALAGCRSFSMIQQLRDGTRSSCSPVLARGIADALSVEPEALFQFLHH